MYIITQTTAHNNMFFRPCTKFSIRFSYARKVETFLNFTQYYLQTYKNTQVVTKLQQTCSNAVPTTCQQDVFALLVPSLLTSCPRLVDNLLQGCRAQQICYKVVPTTCFKANLDRTTFA
jgi:hypothetical protein